MGSHFKERLYESRGPLLGMFTKFPAIEATEIMASAGLDFIIVDMEHAPLDVETVYRQIVTAERSGMAALVRLRGHDVAAANMFMDAGASGILVPHCSPLETAQELIGGMVFPPDGTRGAGGGGRATRWGLDGPAEYRRGGESGVVRVPMIEDIEAIDQVDQILGLHGVDAVFIGQGDLGQSLGGDQEAVKVALETALDAAKRAGVPAATTAYGDEVAMRAEQGFRWLAIQADTGLFTRSVKQRIDAVREQLGSE